MSAAIKTSLWLFVMVFGFQLLSLSVVAADPVAQQTAEPSAQGLQSSQRDVRYCEIIPIYRSGLKLRAEVYNTLGLNDCPAESWDALNGTELAEELDALTVNMNGPRYWVLDEIEATGGVSQEGKIAQFGDLEMAQRGAITLSRSDLKQSPYIPHTINRETRYTFYADHKVYELISPTGDVFIMQSYAQIVDPTLTIDDLNDLGDRLELPDGWSYQIRVLEEDFELVTRGQATVVQDDLFNSYQQVTP